MKNSRAKMKIRAEEKSDKYCNSIDPLYKLFLDHLKPDGTSYILQIEDREFGTPLYLKYEGEKTSSSHLKAKFKSPKKAAKKKRSDYVAPSVEESYERFLKHLKFKEGLMVLELEGGRKVVYEEDRNSSSDNATVQNVVGSDKMAHMPCTGASGSNGEENELDASAADLRSFDEKLTAVLSEPFNQNEYEALMNEAIHRKPVMKHRNLRNMSKQYHTHEAGLSYLDYYPDLAIQICEANKYERLNLLRKFFFWLENLCHDGAYMPWVPKALNDKPIFDEEFEN